MKSMFTVLKFEYSGMTKPKSFKITTIIFALILLIAASLPMITGLFGRGGSGDDIGGGGDYFFAHHPAIFYDETGWYMEDVLASFLPQYNWQRANSPAELPVGLEDESFDVGLHFTFDGLIVYQPGSDAMFGGGTWAYWDMARAVAQTVTLSEAGVDDRTIANALAIDPQMEVITIGRDQGQGYWITLVLSLLLFLCISMYGSQVVHSVSTEKTSKAVELITISTTPYAMMFGKVLAAGLVGLSQILIALVPAIVALHVFLDRWHAFSPMIGHIIELAIGSNILPLALIYFLLGFFTYAFVFAGLASTVSKAEDVGSIQALPSLLLMVSYYLSFGNMFGAESLVFRILSFAPFFSPLVMLSRIGMAEVPMWEIAISIGANVLYIVLLGILCAKLYRVGVMLTGNRLKLGQLFKLIRQA